MYYGKLLRQIAETLRSSGDYLPQNLADISEKIHKNTTAIRDATEAQNETWEKVPAYLSELRVSADERTKAESYRKKAHRQQVWLTWGTWLAFIAAGIYAGIAAIQLAVMKAQLSELIKQYPEIRKSAEAATAAASAAQYGVIQTQEQFRLDQRPYIWQTSKTTEGPSWVPSPGDNSKGQIAWNWHMSNFGKSPGNNVRFTQEMKLAGHPWLMSYGQKGENQGPPQLSGGDTFDTVISAPITAQEYSRLLAINEGISIRVTIRYTGLDGGDYETQLELARTNAGSIVYSKNDNYIK